jgi:poly(hydroxyalkanoate) depolymerase family esterase
LCSAATIAVPRRWYLHGLYGGRSLQGYIIFTTVGTALADLIWSGSSIWHGGIRAPLCNLTWFGSNPGWLRARTYTPVDLPRDAPLVVVLHGCGQSATEYNYGSGWSVLAERYGFALLFPEQQRYNNLYRAFNWFAAEDSRRNKGEARSIKEMVEALVIKHGLDRRRIFITGLSAGGAMTSVMLATYPDVFAGGAIIAGLPYGGAISASQAISRMRGSIVQSDDELGALVRNASAHRGPWPTISIWHGSADYTVHASNAQAILAQWRSVHDVAALPSRTDLIDGYPHQVWCNSRGRPLIEQYSITGMGHGTPVDIEDVNHCGTSGAYMLDASISSTRHIARFWGLTTARPKILASPAETSRKARPYTLMTPLRRGAQDILSAPIRNASTADSGSLRQLG